MENSAVSWLSELGMVEDQLFCDQYDVLDFLDEDNLSAAFGEDFQCTLSPKTNSSNSTLIPRSSSTTSLWATPAMEAPPISNVEKPPKLQKPKNYNHNTSTIQKMSTPFILTFGNKCQPELNSQHTNMRIFNSEDYSVSEVLKSPQLCVSLEEATKSSRPKKKTGGRTRPLSQTYDHILAERKRREQLSQHFVALSAIVPGLKKMDKISVLEDAIKYLKHLQERVKTLEEQSTKQTVESVVLVKKLQIFLEDEGSSDEMGTPEIEAKVCDRKVLLQILCEKNKGVLVKILSEIEKINLAVTNIYVSPFGSMALAITIIAEMEKEFNLTMKELIRTLRSALQQVTVAD